MLRVLSIFALILPASPALAGATPWQDVAPGARLRLITSDALQAEGTTLIALEIDIEPQMKTYWRVPGETGVPTQLDVSGSDGVTAAHILWPLPERETRYGYIDHVYYGHTVLPVSLDLSSDRPRLEMSVLTGICWDICVPVTVAFDLDLDFASPDHAQSLRIDQAVAEVPVAWFGPSPIGEIAFDTETEVLSVEVTDPAFDFTEVIADTEDPAILFGSPQKSPIEGVWTIPLLGRLPPEGLRAGPVRFNFRTPDGAFQITRQIVEISPAI